MYKVVIIDDEPWTRGTIKSLAQWENLRMEVVGEAADGETGLDLVHRVVPDVIITDVCMPRMSGLDLAETLHKEGNKTPILIISGHEDYDYMRSALKLGVVDYILKPINRQELNQMLARCVGVLEEHPAKSAPPSLVADFLAEGWQEQYESIQQKISIALQLGNEQTMEVEFNRLRQAIINYEGNYPDQTVQIALYYALVSPLSKHMEAMGLNKKGTFSGENTTFVFSRDNSIEDMLKFVQSLYSLVIRQVEQQRLSTGLDIKAVCRHIEEYYTTPISLEEVAQIFHVSKEHLSKTFKVGQGVGFSQYVLSLRMNKARELILEQKTPLKDVGFLVGYVDLAHFYKNFKKYFGKTPKNMRDELIIDNKISL